MATVNVKKIIQELVVPELQGIRTDVATIKVEIKRLDEKIDSLKNEFSVRFVEMERRFDGMEKRIDTAIDIHERLATIEAKLASH